MAIDPIAGSTISVVSKPTGKSHAEIRDLRSQKSTADSVDIADLGREISAALKVDNNAEGINLERIADVQRSLQNGSYVVDNERLARKIIHLEKQLANTT